MKLQRPSFWVWKWILEPQKADIYVLHTIADTKRGCQDKVIDWIGVVHKCKLSRQGIGRIVRVEFVE